MNPPPKPFHFDVNETNEHFATTAERTLNTNATSPSNILDFINNLPRTDDDSFTLRAVTYNEVQKELKNLRKNASTGSDNIPAKYIKLIADTICSPLTYIINSYINSNSYPTKWKLSRVVPVPKVKNPNTINEYRPISIQVALSKVFERLVLLQLLSFIENNHLYKDTMTGFRKGFNTNNA